MRTTRLAALVVIFFIAAVGYGQSNRTFVSAGNGDDLAACTRIAPCRSFSRAASLTNAGGELVALDSGGYGPFSISQDLSVAIPDGVYAGVTATGTADGIVVSGGSRVLLKGLTINITGTGTGIHFNGGVKLVVDRCVIQGGVRGVWVDGFVFGGLSATVVRSVFLGNGTGVTSGASNAATWATIDACTFINCGTGVSGGPHARMFLSNSTLTDSSVGAEVTFNSRMVIENCRFGNNGTGVQSASSDMNIFGTVRISSSTITASGTAGLVQSGFGLVYSRGNNTFEENTNDTQGTITPFSGK